MANPGNIRAQALINQLHAGGLSYSEIARRIGRDSSLVSQIARKGNKGASFVPALEKLAAGEKGVTIERRKTKSGGEAKVRRGVEIKEGDNFVVDTKKGNKTIMSGIQHVSGKGKYLKWRITVSWVKTISERTHRNTGIDGHLPRGWTTDDLMNRINNPQAGDNWKAGDAANALKEIALSQNQGAFTSAGAVKGIHLYSMN